MRCSKETSAAPRLLHRRPALRSLQEDRSISASRQSMTLNRLRGKRLQARSGSRWTKNTLESVFGLTAPVCPTCRHLNPHAVNEPPPARCQSCGVAMIPACPTHGEAQCGETCASRPCSGCGGTGAAPPFIDPKAWREDRICKKCGRQVGCCAGCGKPLDPVRRGPPERRSGSPWHSTCVEDHAEHALTMSEIL